MIISFMKLLFLLLICISSVAYACGDNPNAIIQGPFKDDSFEDGYICFQHTPDKRDVEFYLSYESKDGPQNNLVDVFFYSDAPVEVMSVFLPLLIQLSRLLFFFVGMLIMR